MTELAIYDMDRTITRTGTFTPFMIHAALRRECKGPAAAVASADQLQERIDRIRHWATSRSS